MLSQTEVLQELNKDVWSPTAVNATIAAKAEKRAGKGQDLHTYTLDLSPINPIESTKFNEEKLNEFVDLIHQKALESDTPVRIQLAVRTSVVHWTAIDLEISKSGVKMIQVDAAGDPTYETGLDIYEALEKKFTDKSQSKFYCLIHEEFNPDPDTYKTQGIQYDEDSCSRFALDILFHMSNMPDPFQIFANKEQEFSTIGSQPNARIFNAKNMPTEMSFIYRGTQSKESFQSLPSELHQQTINKKGETLAEAETKHTKKIKIKDKIKLSNQVMQYKKQGYIDDVTQAMNDQKFLGKIPERDVLTALHSGTFLAKRTFDNVTIARNLIAEAGKIEQSKAWSLMNITQKFRNRSKLAKAERALNAGNPIEAIQYLEKMRGITDDYKQYLVDTRTKMQSEASTEHQNTNAI
ncbi:MAG: hypothetical protein ACO1N3_02265 [Gammaproteobacteria bacterium]